MDVNVDDGRGDNVCEHVDVVVVVSCCIIDTPLDVICIVCGCILSSGCWFLFRCRIPFFVMPLTITKLR